MFFLFFFAFLVEVSAIGELVVTQPAGPVRCGDRSLKLTIKVVNAKALKAGEMLSINLVENQLFSNPSIADNVGTATFDDGKTELECVVAVPVLPGTKKVDTRALFEVVRSSNREVLSTSKSCAFGVCVGSDVDFQLLCDEADRPQPATTTTTAPAAGATTMTAASASAGGLGSKCKRSSDCKYFPPGLACPLLFGDECYALFSDGRGVGPCGVGGACDAGLACRGGFCMATQCVWPPADGVSMLGCPCDKDVAPCDATADCHVSSSKCRAKPTEAEKMMMMAEDEPLLCGAERKEADLATATAVFFCTADATTKTACKNEGGNDCDCVRILYDCFTSRSCNVPSNLQKSCQTFKCNSVCPSSAATHGLVSIAALILSMSSIVIFA